MPGCRGHVDNENMSPVEWPGCMNQDVVSYFFLFGRVMHSTDVERCVLQLLRFLIRKKKGEVNKGLGG